MPSRTLTLVRHPAATLSILLFAATTTIWAQNDDLRLPPPTFTEAADAWQAGRYDEALIALEDRLATSGASPWNGLSSLEALVLRATIYGHLGRHHEAEADWQDLTKREVWMRTFARRALVMSMTERGASAEAVPILEELNRSDATRHLDLTLRVADVYLESGETRAARELYQQVVVRQSCGAPGDDARLGIAASWEQDGDVTAALAALREAKLRHRRPDTFEAAAKAESSLAAARQRASTPFSEPEYRTLVRRLRNASRFRPALTLIDEWRAEHSPERPSAEIEAERITTLYVQRANADAVAACRDFYQHFPDSSLLPGIRLTDFRLAVRMVDTKRARQSGLDLWEGRVRGATPRQRRDAATLLAAYLVAVGDLSGGLDLYRQLFQSAESADEQRSVLWRAGVAALRDGQHERALANLESLVDRNPSGDLAPAGLYWLGVAQSQDDVDAGTRTLAAVARRFPYHYYGMRARERLQRVTRDTADPLEETTLTFPQLALKKSTEERAEYRASMVLARAGLVDDAAWYLRRLLASDSDPALALLTARASAEARDYASVARVLVNHFAVFLQRPADGLPNDFWNLVYPRPFWDDVSGSGTTHGVDPLFLVSLMRQESRFDPDARSTVGAIGLFQIMTYTAEALAERAGVAEVLEQGTADESILAKPSVNAAIAARLSGDLFRLFDGASAPVAASYNAGEERVAVWWATSRELSEDFFVDTIPYSETRRFVREVLANRSAYERIYGDQ